MKVEKGDVVKIEYTAKFEAGDVIDTSNEETAKEAGVHDAEKKYEPLVVKAGIGHIIQGVDEALIGMKKDEEKETIIPPEKGYGEKKQDNIRSVPKRLFVESGIEPQKGLMVGNPQGQQATITKIFKDSVEVDFNHPLAGETLVFDIKILDIKK